VTSDVSVEAEGETVGEAKWAAVRELERIAPDLDRDSVEFQVVSEGERGLLGVGYSPARVIASVTTVSRGTGVGSAPPGDHEPSSEEAGLAAEFVSRSLAAMEIRARTTIEESADAIVVTLAGDDLGALIGRHGQTLDALQYLANALAHKAFGEDRHRITVDAGGYRDRRARTIEAIAERSAEQAAGTGRRVELEPMSAVERKLVHELLKEDPAVTTTSEGTEPNRHVVVVPATRDD
jgi:spoIIIJ-associated protein